MAIVELLSRDIIKYLVSQNTDGLHRKSGVALNKFSELHGNQTLEKCPNPTCLKEYIRDYRTRTAEDVHDHKTDRLCAACGGPLYDSIINFGETLPEKEITESFKQADIADLCIVLGSSLTVNPAAEIPKTVATRGKPLIIVNQQETPLDKHSTYKFTCSTDKFMEEIMSILQIPIPLWLLKRQFTVGYQILEDNTSTLTLKGIDRDGCPATIFNGVKLYLPVNFFTEIPSLTLEPFQFKIEKKFNPSKLSIEDIVINWSNNYIKKILNRLNVNHSSAKTKEEKAELIIKYANTIDQTAQLTLSFFGHYHEPDYTLNLLLTENTDFTELISYDVTTGLWSN